MNTYTMSYINNFQVDDFKNFINKHKDAKSIIVTCKSGNEKTLEETKNVLSNIISERFFSSVKVTYNMTYTTRLKNDDIIVEVTAKE